MKDLKIEISSILFPFTEPSAEVDINYSHFFRQNHTLGEGSKWLEILGCGMVHPNVFKMSGVKEKFNWFAFGMGIERLAMLKYGMPDLRDFYEVT